MEGLIMLAEAVAAGSRLLREFLAHVDEYATAHGMSRKQVLDALATQMAARGRSAAIRVVGQARTLASSEAVWNAAMLPMFGVLTPVVVRAIRRRRASH